MLDSALERPCAVNRIETGFTEQIERDVRQYFQQQVYQTVIPRNVRMSEAPSHGKPALLYDINCSGSKAYVSLATEMLARERKIKAQQNAAA